MSARSVACIDRVITTGDKGVCVVYLKSNGRNGGEATVWDMQVERIEI
jgi:hypothetical protein